MGLYEDIVAAKEAVETFTPPEVWVHPRTQEEIVRAFAAFPQTHYAAQMRMIYGGVSVFTDCRLAVGTVQNEAATVGGHACVTGRLCSAAQQEKGS